MTKQSIKKKGLKSFGPNKQLLNFKKFIRLEFKGQKKRLKLEK